MNYVRTSWFEWGRARCSAIVQCRTEMSVCNDNDIQQQIADIYMVNVCVTSWQVQYDAVNVKISIFLCSFIILGKDKNNIVEWRRTKKSFSFPFQTKINFK